MLKSPWVIAAIVIIITALLFWLFVKAGKRIIEWVHEPVEPGKPRWTYALTPLAAALAPLAAFSALLPSYLNQQQSDKKFMAESERTRTDATWHRTRLDTETQSEQFLLVQSRFGSPDDKTRAVAALQLADLALLPKPSAGSDAFEDANYSNFAATGTQIAVALQMEQNADVRAAYREAMRKLVAFAATSENSHWQYALTNQLAGTNRRITRAFTESLGRYAAVNDVTEPSTLRVLATVAPFTSDPNTTMIALRDLMTTEDFRADRRIGARLRDALPGEARRTADAALLASVQTNALRLMDSRDALAESLRALKPAPPLPAVAVPDIASLLPGAKAAAPQTKPTLKLQGCFLPGANLWEAFLGGADVTGANFTGANLKRSDLTGANLETAIHLPPSVTKANQGPDTERVPQLKQKYPKYDWATVEQRGAETPQTPKTENPAEKATEAGAALLDRAKNAVAPEPAKSAPVTP